MDSDKLFWICVSHVPGFGSSLGGSAESRQRDWFTVWSRWDGKERKAGMGWERKKLENLGRKEGAQLIPGLLRWNSDFSLFIEGPILVFGW